MIYILLVVDQIFYLEHSFYRFFFVKCSGCFYNSKSLFPSYYFSSSFLRLENVPKEWSVNK